MDRLAKTVEILEGLVSFPSISDTRNLELIDYIRSYLDDLGIGYSISFDESGEKANLYATVGPEIDGGVVFNGHSDVVPVTGQNWTSDPFSLRAEEGRLYGRGAVDMKGFLACVLAKMPDYQAMELTRPVHFSICFDEENGGFGAPILVSDINSKNYKPAIAIVGEPTSMQIIGGHKGSIELKTTVTGAAGHASMPALGVNAIHYATRFIARLLALSEELKRRAPADTPFDPPYSTISVGVIQGGAARNIIASECIFDWEIRLVQPEDGDFVLSKMDEFVGEILLPEMREKSDKTAIISEIEAPVPPLEPTGNQEAIDFVSSITGLNSVGVVAFATDAGHFAKGDISTVVFGPGNIEQAHMADEYIEESQLVACLDFLDQVGRKLSA